MKFMILVIDLTVRTPPMEHIIKISSYSDESFRFDQT